MSIKHYLIYQHGDESVLQMEESPLPQPAAGQVLVRHTAIGVNLIDIYPRRGSLFEAMRNGWLQVDIHQRYPLAEAPRAQRELANRQTIGSSILLPG